jgi:hypothetical protein
MKMRAKIWVALLLIAGLGLLPRCDAHQAGVSYIIVDSNQTELMGQWKAAIRDLEMVIGLDSNGDGKVTWAELREHLPAIEEYFVAHLGARSEGRNLPLRLGAFQVEELNSEMFAVLSFSSAEIVSSQPIEVNYSAFFERDAGHRGIFEVTTGSSTRITTFSPSHQTETLERTPSSAGFAKLVNDGIWHIWTGADHILFLLSLLLPSVLRRRGTAWQPAAHFGEALGDVARTVTAFTVAHSITLALASLRYIVIPAKLIEIAIAASVVFAALNNIFPLISENRWTAAFGFGLIHGFGFAGVLTDLNISGALLAKSLLGFNLGVEIGQLVIVAGFLPIAFLLRESKGYRRIGLQLSSAAIALIAGVWICERLFGIRIIPI